MECEAIIVPPASNIGLVKSLIGIFHKRYKSSIYIYIIYIHIDIFNLLVQSEARKKVRLDD